MMEEEFSLWLKTKFTDYFWIRGHKFGKAEGGKVKIDNGLFTQEEAAEIFSMLTSKNPINRWNAMLLIWERNGTLLKVLVVGSFILLLFIFLITRR